MKHFRFFLTVSLTIWLLVLGIAIPSHAASVGQLSTGDRQHIIDFFRQYSVPKSRWEPLLRKLDEGRPWDSLTGVAPSKVEVQDTPSSAIRVSRYPDGSVMVTTVERPNRTVSGGGITPMANLSECSVYGGSGYAVYRGCKVENQWGNIYLGFKADYELISGNRDQIDAVYGQTATVWGWGWTSTGAAFDPIKYVEDAWGAASARAVSRVSAPWGSWDVWVQLNVGGDRGWATSS